MDIGTTRLIKLELIRYREAMDLDYIYFWTEKYNGQTVSPIFEHEEDALSWYKEIMTKVEQVLCKRFS